VNRQEHGLEEIFRDLHERAKELRCLYQVGEILRADELSWRTRLFRVLEVIPPGWQYPEVCEARLELRGFSSRTEGYEETGWFLEEPILVQGKVAGAVRVVYTEERPQADEGPFLDEERTLLRTIAQQIGFQHSHEDLATAWGSWEAALQQSGTEEGAKWQVIIDFLDRADSQLMQRINRRMLNHLRWKGVEGLETIPGYPQPLDPDTDGPDENQPMAHRPGQIVLIPTDQVFRIAAEHCSEEEILASVHGWINQDKLSFLINTLEWQESSLKDIVDALGRFRALEMAERELPPTLVNVMRAALLRRFFTDEIDFINAAKPYVTLLDFHSLARHLIYPPNSHGKLGGKSAGLFLAWKIVEHEREEHEVLRGIRVPRTWHIASDGIIALVRHNNLEDVYDRKYMELDQVRQQYPYVIQVFKSSSFPPELLNGLSQALDDLGDCPLIVRSSSLLEDRTGASFSGKYKSLFLANQGSRAERLAALLDAVAEVYASIFGPDPIEYRTERNLLDVHEEMGIMIQEVVGVRVGRYFLPAFSGVAFSNNEFRWSPRIRRDDGLVRLVPGLGTRAVDRVTDDFPVLLSPGQPGLRVNATPDEIIRYSPKMVDLIDLETRSLETVALSVLLEECGNDLPLIRKLVSVVDHDEIRRPGGFTEDLTKEDAVVTFEGLATDTPFLGQMATLLEVLQETMGGPVDVEFACDGKDLYLLQCRAQSYTEESAPPPIPRNLARKQVLFTANRYVSNGRIPDITHVVWVDPEEYGRLSELSELKSVGRAVSRLNKVLPRRSFILMGPGRWGSRGDIRLGVSVTYSDINNTALLVEIAYQTGEYVPELSFGTHFFQDLVEARIRYLPLYPGQDGNVFDVLFFRRAENLLPELASEFAHLADVVRVVEIPRQTEGKILRVLMNADLDEAVGFLTDPGPTPTTAGPAAPFPGPLPLVTTEPAQEEHWRWRLRMAEKLGSKLDPERFGVEDAWVFGSTKNATAGPDSDIDLLLHFTGTEEQKLALLAWLEGWSLSLAEINYLRTGYRSHGLLDVHLISDQDIRNRTSYAVKIDAVTDPARRLAMGVREEAG
jgi:pyruvate,water dikinase